MYYLIYQIKNKINNKIYIGQHQTEDLNDNYMGSGNGIKNAIKKHSKENFEKRILFNLKSFEAMNEMEKILVDEWFVNRKDTYNHVTGGQKDNQKGKKHSEESKIRMSHARKGKIKSEQERKNSSEARKGAKNVFYGKKHSEETKEKLKEINKGKKHSEETKRKVSEAGKGRIFSEESKRKMSLAQKGKKHSEETKRKMSRPMSEETKRKISESKKGKKHKLTELLE